MLNLTLPEAIQKPDHGEGLILEAWAQGLLVGAFVVMAGITVANMRKGVLLHKLILIEVSSALDKRLFDLTSPSLSLACLTERLYLQMGKHMACIFP